MAGATRFAATAVVTTALLSACGGSSEPTAAERKAAKNRWIQRVDAACQKANEAIADRGWPTDLIDLDRLVVRGIDDAQAAIRTITGLTIPEGAGPKPGAFVEELKALEPELTKLSEASEGLEPAALVKAAEALKPRLVTAEKAAEEAGVGDCLSHDERFFVPDAVRAPVFAEQLDKLDRSLLRRINRIDFAEASTPGEFAQAFDRYSEVIDTALKGIDTLDPPQWAAQQTADYADALRDLQSETQTFTALLVQDKGKAPYELDRSKYLRAQKDLNVAANAEMKTRRRMLRAVGAAPTDRLPRRTRPPSRTAASSRDSSGERRAGRGGVVHAALGQPLADPPLHAQDRRPLGLDLLLQRGDLGVQLLDAVAGRQRVPQRREQLGAAA